MFTSMVAVLLLLLPAAADKKVAMVLSIKGPVTLQTREGAQRPARVMDMLFAGDHLTIPANGEAHVVILGDNHRERLKPGTQVTITVAGCTPAGAVERKAAVNTAVAYQDVQRFAGGGLGAVLVLRGPRIPKKQPAVTPMFDSTVLADRPFLSWRPVDGVSQYQVRLVLGRLDTDGDKDGLVWTARTTEPRLPYPEQANPLHSGSVYSWYVIARAGQKDEQVVWRSQFWVATREEAVELAQIKPLAAGKNPADLLLAALTYQEYGVYDEALVLFQRLAELLPQEARFQSALANYYERAGRSQEAREALERAKKLSPESSPR